jgi:hypothetical protein
VADWFPWKSSKHSLVSGNADAGFRLPGFPPSVLIPAAAKTQSLQRRSKYGGARQLAAARSLAGGARRYELSERGTSLLPWVGPAPQASTVTTEGES